MSTRLVIRPPARTRLEVGAPNTIRMSSQRVTLRVSTSVERVDATRYLHDQTSPSTLWTVTHNLGVKPAAVMIALPDGRVVGASVIHIDDNTLTITHNSPAVGTAVIM
jgi:hypothetical protein